MTLKLTHRQQHVLWATVRHYVATAEPVGSKALVKEFDFQVSSATIRNAMGMLERSGLLYQPYTSAGRVPSDSGYRIYVDRLIDPSPQLTQQFEQSLTTQLNWEELGFELILQGAAQLLATISGCIALITMPQTQTALVRHIQLIQLDSGQVMLIVVTDAYETQSASIALPQSPDNAPLDPELVERELQILSNFLNHHLKGRAFSELATLEWSDLDREFERYADCWRSLIKSLMRRVKHPAPTQMVMRGMTEVLRQPEFSELQQVKAIVRLLEEEQNRLCPLIFEASDLDSETDSGKRVTVRIGSENPLESIQTCTLISATYRRGEVPVGSVGILGPTRLDYEGAIATVGATADYLSEAMSA